MPEMTGDSLTQKLIDLKKGIQVIIITGKPTFEVATDCFNMGAAYFLEKPIFHEHLKLAVQNCVNRLELWQETIARNK